MQSFLVKCAALGIVAGGFTLTGDVGRLAERSRRLLEARTVPSETPPADHPPAGHLDAVAKTTEIQPPPDVPAASPTRAASSVSVVDTPMGRAVTVPAPPAKGPDSIDLRYLPAGSRVLVWIQRPGASPRRPKSPDLIALDLIDASTGEALEHRHAAMTHGSADTTMYAAPRRVVIARDASGRLAKGSMLRLAPMHGVNGLSPEETVGTVMAIDVR